MKEFIYRKKEGITALSARFTDFHYKTHSHREYALGVTLEGVQKYRLSGSEQRSYPGGIMLFNPEQPHDGMAGDGGVLDYLMLYIEPELLLDVLDRTDTVSFSSPLIYDPPLQNKIVNLACNLIKDGDDMLLDEGLLALSTSLFPSLLSEDRKKDDQLIERAKEMIHDDLNDLVSLEAISGELGISKFKFIRMFKGAAGISPYQYYLNCKVEAAREILERTGDVYSAVADCNFVDLTHLNRHFKTIYGVTASRYLSEIT